MLAKGLAGAPLGIDAYPVEVDVLAKGLQQFASVGLPEEAVKESKDRIKSAIKNSRYDFPTRITIDLLPPTSARTAPPSTCQWRSAQPPPPVSSRQSSPSATCS